MKILYQIVATWIQTLNRNYKRMKTLNSIIFKISIIYVYKWLHFTMLLGLARPKQNSMKCVNGK